MKLVSAYIRPFLLEDVFVALRKEGHCCMTVFQGEGTGEFKDPENQHGSMMFPAMHTKIVKIEILAEDEEVDTIADIIKEKAHTGRKGDGLIYVSPISSTVQI